MVSTMTMMRCRVWNHLVNISIGKSAAKVFAMQHRPMAGKDGWTNIDTDPWIAHTGQTAIETIKDKKEEAKRVKLQTASSQSFQGVAKSLSRGTAQAVKGWTWDWQEWRDQTGEVLQAGSDRKKWWNPCCRRSVLVWSSPPDYARTGSAVGSPWRLHGSANTHTQTHAYAHRIHLMSKQTNK